jgi:hypothetical protein
MRGREIPYKYRLRVVEVCMVIGNLLDGIAAYCQIKSKLHINGEIEQINIFTTNA